MKTKVTNGNAFLSNLYSFSLTVFFKYSNTGKVTPKHTMIITLTTSGGRINTVKYNLDTVTPNNNIKKYQTTIFPKYSSFPPRRVENIHITIVKKRLILNSKRIPVP